MLVSKISYLNNIAFMRNKISKPENTEVKGGKEIKDRKKKLVITLGVLAGAGIAAIAIAKSRKIPSEMSIEKFKKAGGFEKVDNNGITQTLAMYKKKPYTGTLLAANKNGDYQLIYKDGVLDSSLCIKTVKEGGKAFASASEKVYSYAENGKLTDVSVYRYYNNENCADKFSADELINGNVAGRNLVKVENGSVHIEDGAVAVEHLGSDFDTVTTKRTLFNKDGLLKDRVNIVKKCDKEKIMQVIRNASDKQTNLL